MLDSMEQRGPHGSRVQTLPGHGAFGHMALPLYANATEQPWVADDGTAVTFSGEIYNARELSSEEFGADTRFPGEAPLLALMVKHHGAASLSRLRGMYSIAIWDPQRAELTLARDRLGKKPLYYTWQPSEAGDRGEVVFASVLDALSSGLHDSPPPATEVLTDYVRTRCVPAPGTAFRGVFKIRPGEVMTIRHGKVSALLNRSVRGAGPAPRTPAPDLRTLLARAIDRRTVPLSQQPGLLFSGGVDSTAVGALLNRVTPRPVDAFCVVSSSEEERWIRLLADDMGVRVHVEHPNVDDLADESLAALQDLDEPMADPSLVVTRRAARLASCHTEVVLTGDGADELFYGYRWFEVQHLLHLLRRVPDPVVRQSLLTLGSQRLRGLGLPITPFAADIAASVGAPPDKQFLLAHAGAPPETLLRLLGGSTAVHPEDHRTARSRDDALARSRDGIFRRFLVDLVITKIDRATMAYGVEARSPFLDEDLVAWGLSLRPTDCRRGRLGKAPVRALVKDLVGRRPALRRKQGFRAPLAAVLRGPLRPLVESRLASDRLRDTGRWDPVTVDELVRDHMVRGVDRTQILWTLLVYESWRERCAQGHEVGVTAP
ncbi:asparagine synthetase B family protein [Actinomyces wuliandei]|uniref:asparagine synthetase B family protein n=2 Tax=Actinomyces wuliandei TaxID=2057743 RepID=UPI0013E3F85E|nr:asparagine synthase-related protein [Actinomyces wuliandei]